MISLKKDNTNQKEFLFEFWFCFHFNYFKKMVHQWMELLFNNVWRRYSNTPYPLYRNYWRWWYQYARFGQMLWWCSSKNWKMYCDWKMSCMECRKMVNGKENHIFYLCAFYLNLVLHKIHIQRVYSRARGLVVGDLRSETKDS